MTKSELIRTLAKRSRIKQESAEAYLNDLMSIITDTIAKGEEIKIPRFGVFKTRTQSARSAYDFHRGNAIEVPEKRAVSFTPSKELKAAINATQEDTQA